MRGRERRARRATRRPLVDEGLVCTPRATRRSAWKRVEQRSPRPVALDHAGDLAYIAPSRVNLTMTQERWPEIEFLATREHGIYD